MRSLEPREKGLLIIASAVAVIFIAYFSLRGSDKKGGKEDLAKLKKTRTEFFSQLENYKALQLKNDVIDRRLKATPKNYQTSSKTALIEELNGYLNTLGIAYQGMSPSEGGGTDFFAEASVTVEIREVSLTEMVSLLKMIESSPAFLRVSNLNVRRKEANLTEPSPLDVSMKVSVYTPKNEQAP